MLGSFHRSDIALEYGIVCSKRAGASFARRSSKREKHVRPCTNCRSTDTVALSTGFLPRLASVLGGNPELVAYVCRTCRHVDVWLDEKATLPEKEIMQVPEIAAPA
jgi:hypothetical protein